eukprot:Tamp_08646.p1 GENE.Tamp_08646~~Tamp_08646.p1  ORF type:complete len:609 (-),score=126.35 Tamp_08646:469-2295(-)
MARLSPPHGPVLLLMLLQATYLQIESATERPIMTPGGLRWPQSKWPARHQGGMYEVPDAPCGGLRPLTIFHAFDWRFHGVKWKLDDLRNAGYDAVQISPCQKSIGDQQWWERYQPISHAYIEGLGSPEELQDLCRAASERDIMVIADLVFNHMATVATSEEWSRAQHHKGFEQELLRRLDERFPPLTRDDFHPWKACRQEDWDNENRFDVWGDGVWCDLKATPRVLDLHKQHVDQLLRCGVRGFRFDAAKHIHPNTLANYASYIRAKCPDAYIYFEVLSADVEMHKETTGIATSTDFDMCLKLRNILVHSHDPRRIATLPLLSNDAVRFARNHDTIHNEHMAREWGYRSDSVVLTLAWVIILAMDGGTVLMYSDDADRHIRGGKPMEAAVRFRKEMLYRHAPPHHILFVSAQDKEEEAEGGRTKSAKSGSKTVTSVPSSTPSSLTFPAWMMKELDAQELQHLASAVAVREGVVKVLERHAAALLQEAHKEKRQEEADKHAAAAKPAPKARKQTKASSAGSADAHKGLLCVVRGAEGFVCINLSKSWFDTPRLRFDNTELQGSYKEAVYGFNIEINADHTVVRWGGDASGLVKIGPQSALVFTRTSVTL